MNTYYPKVLHLEDYKRWAPSVLAEAPIESVSDKYTFVSTYELIQSLKDHGWHACFAKQQQVRKAERQGFQKHMVRFFHEDNLYAGKNERIDLVLYNSHDTGCAYKIFCSIWRMVCANGLIAAVPFLQFIHKHMGLDKEEFIHSAVAIAKASGKLSTKVEELKRVELSNHQRLNFAREARNRTFGEKYRDDTIFDPNQLLHVHRYADREKNLWSTFNVVQENVIKGGSSAWVMDENGRHTYTRGGRMKYTTFRKVKSIDRDIRINKELWGLTEEFAKAA